MKGRIQNTGANSLLRGAYSVSRVSKMVDQEVIGGENWAHSTTSVQKKANLRVQLCKTKPIVGLRPETRSTNVDAVFQQMRSESVTQRMRLDVLVDAERIAGLIEGIAQRLLAERRCAVAVWEEQTPMTVGSPEAAQGREQCLWQRQNTFLVSLANDAYDHLC